MKEWDLSNYKWIRTPCLKLRIISSPKNESARTNPAYKSAKGDVAGELEGLERSLLSLEYTAGPRCPFQSIY